MSDNTNLQEIIAFFGDTKLNVNPNFKKYKEHCPFDPYGVIIERSYRARLSDITSDLDEVKQEFKEAGRQFHNDIFVLVELSFLKTTHEPANICISAFPYVAFCDSGDSQHVNYCGDKEAPAAVITENVEEAEEYLENLLTSETIITSVVKTIKRQPFGQAKEFSA